MDEMPILGFAITSTKGSMPIIQRAKQVAFSHLDVSPKSILFLFHLAWLKLSIALTREELHKSLLDMRRPKSSRLLSFERSEWFSNPCKI